MLYRRPCLSDACVVVVCSAQSTGTKNEGTTTRLIQAATEAENDNWASKHYEDIVTSIWEDHTTTAAQSIRSPLILKRLRTEIQTECQELLALLTAAQKLEEISTKSRNKVIGKGEILSCRLMTALLQDHGIDAQFVDLSNIVPLTSLPQNLNQEFYDNVASLLYKKIQTCGNKVPVVTGYFGTISGGILEQVGRGYTDLCAALIVLSPSAYILVYANKTEGRWSQREGLADLERSRRHFHGSML